MADIGSFVTATLKEQVVPKISDQIILANKLLYSLNKAGRFSYGKGGNGFQIRVRYAESTIGGSTTDWAVQDLQTTQPFTTAEDTYRQYSWKLILSTFQMQRNENAGPTAWMFDMAEQQINEVKQAATTRIGRHSYTGTGTLYTGDVGTPMNGLADIIGSTTNTFMGINRTTTANAYWRPQSATVANFTADSTSIGVSDGLQAMQTLWLACSLGMQKGDDIPDTVATEMSSPDFIITSSTGWNGYFRSLQPQQRYADSTKANPLETLQFNGVPVLWDNFCPSDKMYFINEDTFHVWISPNKLLDVLQEGDAPNPIGKYYIFGTQLQMYSDKPRYNGTLTITAL